MVLPHMNTGNGSNIFKSCMQYAAPLSNPIVTTVVELSVVCLNHCFRPITCHLTVQPFLGECLQHQQLIKPLGTDSEAFCSICTVAIFQCLYQRLEIWKRGHHELTISAFLVNGIGNLVRQILSAVVESYGSTHARLLISDFLPQQGNEQ